MNPQYVVYITHYHGNLLPPFYIGYTTEAKVLAGYNGSVSSKKYKKIWRQERKERPDSFDTQVLSHHETDLDARAREESWHRFYEVPNNPAFINMAFSNGRFGVSGPKSPDTIRKMSLSKKGRPPCNKGTHMSEAQKLKISQSKKGKPNNVSPEMRAIKIIKSHTPEANEKRSKTQLGRKRGPYKKRESKDPSLIHILN